MKKLIRTLEVTVKVLLTGGIVVTSVVLTFFSMFYFFHPMILQREGADSYFYCILTITMISGGVGVLLLFPLVSWIKK
jgi:hypothetical protein